MQMLVMCFLKIEKMNICIHLASNNIITETTLFYAPVLIFLWCFSNSLWEIFTLTQESNWNLLLRESENKQLKEEVSFG